MARTSSERRSRIVEALGFWFVTILICAVAAFGSYRFGREWIGDRLDDDVKSVLTDDDLAEIGPDTFTATDDDEGGSDVADEPPKEPVVEVEAVELSDADERAIKDQDTYEEPEADDEEATADEPADDAPADDEDGDDAAVIEAAEDDSGTSFVVRAGSFGQRANAESLMDQLRDEGYQPFLSTVKVDGKEYTRVNVATYDERDRALKLRDSLRSEGYDADVSTE